MKASALPHDKWQRRLAGEGEEWSRRSARADVAVRIASPWSGGGVTLSFEWH
jgi:hypothetical protein